ncbi:MAG: TldD/PmbA family protein [Planctomycetota bacterium]
MAKAREIAREIVYLATQRGVDFADIRILEDAGTSAVVEDERADKVSRRRETGACVRVLVDGAWGFVAVDTLGRRALLVALDDAIELARSSVPRVSDPAVVASLPAAEAAHETACRRDPRSVAVSEKIAAAKAFEAAARKHGGAAVVNTAVSYSDLSVREIVANTRGALIEQESTRVYISLRVAVAKGGITQLGYERRGIVGGFEVVEDTAAEEFSIRAVDRALALLDAKPAPGGSFPVIFDPSATGLFTHEALGHNAEADAVWTGQSLLAGKMGEKIAADCVTIVDDPTVETKFGYYAYDSEGTPGKRRVIIENGVLREFLHNLETAARFETTPNGAARADGHTARPIVRMSNTFLAPGTSNLEEMIASIDMGVYLKDAQAGYVFPERGQFTCKAGQSFMIENGKLGEPLRDVSVAGLTLEILRNVEMVGADLEIDWPGFCGKGGQSAPTAIGGPHMKVSSLVVGGRIG